MTPISGGGGGGVTSLVHKSSLSVTLPTMKRLVMLWPHFQYIGWCHVSNNAKQTSKNPWHGWHGLFLCDFPTQIPKVFRRLTSVALFLSLLIILSVSMCLWTIICLSIYLASKNKDLWTSPRQFSQMWQRIPMPTRQLQKYPITGKNVVSPFSFHLDFKGNSDLAGR